MPLTLEESEGAGEREYTREVQGKKKRFFQKSPRQRQSRISDER